MKILHYVIGMGTLAIGFSITANADYIQLADRPLTLMLTAKYSAPGLTIKDDTGVYTSFEDCQEVYDKNENLTKEVEKYSAVAKTYKYGKKEIVQYAYENELLEDKTMTGWALIVTDDGNEPTIQLKKKINGEDVYVDVGIYLGGDSDIGVLAEKYDNTISYGYKYDPEFDYYEQVSAVNTVTGNYTEEGKISLDFDDISIVGAYSGSAKIMSFYPQYEDENGKLLLDKSEAIYEFIPAAARISGLVGTAESDDGEFMIITGSAGKGTIVRE